MITKTTCFIHAIFWFGVGLFSMYKYNKHQDYLDITVEAKVRDHALYLLSTATKFECEIVEVCTSFKEGNSRYGWFILRGQNQYVTEYHPFMWSIDDIDNPKINVISPDRSGK